MIRFIIAGVVMGIVMLFSIAYRKVSKGLKHFQDKE